MEIPARILQAFNLYNPKTIVQIQKPDAPKQLTQPMHIDQMEYCPLGCDPSKTRLAISKTGRKDKGNFVQVYYRSRRNKSAKQVNNPSHSDTFWREANVLVERSASKKRPGQREGKSF